MLDPRAEYSRRLEKHMQISARFEQLHRRAGNCKLFVLVAGVLLLWLCAARNALPIGWLALPVLAFAALAVWHERILRGRAAAVSAVGYYRRGIARIEDRWKGSGSSGERFRDPAHTYSDDLDLFGTGGLFELLSAARLPMGENRLAEWLRAPASPETILERQRVIRELRERLDLREDLAVTGEELRVRLDPESLAGWAGAKPLLPPPAWRSVPIALTLVAFATLVYAIAKLEIWPLLAVLGVELFFYRAFHKRALKAIQSIHCNAEGLTLFSQILARLERESSTLPRPQSHVADLRIGKIRASRAIRQLANVVYWIDSRDGLFARLLDLPALYTIQTGFAAERWLRSFGASLPVWIDIVAAMEALLSLSAYSFEHPDDPFPTLEPRGAGAPLFNGVDLGHPLVPSSQCVANSVCLDGQSRVLLVSGSNMSGKSTLLRTIGINTVLAMAGAPIRGKSLRLVPLHLGTRIRSTDSLLENRSNFYTEILRIRRIFDSTNNDSQLLFLFDELLEGTNSHDRRIGAEGLLRALLGRPSIGVVTTHDLALTEITGSLGAAVRNFHFQDYVQNGEMRFDYKLREGVVTRSNALELMRLVGLKL